MGDELTRTILVVTGAVTTAAAIALALPDLTFRQLFGDTTDAGSRLVIRHWGLLVGLVGGLLIYSAYHPEVRVPVMVAAIAEKFAIGALILFSPFRTRPLAATIGIADTAMAVAYVVLLAHPGA